MIPSIYIKLLKGVSDTKSVVFYKGQHRMLKVGKSTGCEWQIDDIEQCEEAVMFCWDGKVLSVLELLSGVALLNGVQLRGHATDLDMGILQIGDVCLNIQKEARSSTSSEEISFSPEGDEEHWDETVIDLPHSFDAGQTVLRAPLAAATVQPRQPNCTTKSKKKNEWQEMLKGKLKERKVFSVCIAVILVTASGVCLLQAEEPQSHVSPSPRVEHTNKMSEKVMPSDIRKLSLHTQRDEVSNVRAFARTEKISPKVPSVALIGHEKKEHVEETSFSKQAPSTSFNVSSVEKAEVVESTVELKKKAAGHCTRGEWDKAADVYRRLALENPEYSVFEKTAEMNGRMGQ